MAGKTESRSSDYPYLILIHIPIRDGGGYKRLTNFDINSPEGQRITKDIESVRFLSETDTEKRSHSIFKFSVTDDNTISVLASFISQESSDESGRFGIVYGVYFLVPVEDFNLDKISEIKKEIFTHLLKLVHEHNEFKKNALAGNDLSELTKGFIKLSEEILKSKTIFPKKDTKREKSTNVEPKPSEFIRSNEVTRQIVKAEIAQYMTSIQKRSILIFGIIIVVGFIGAVAFWFIKNGNFRQNNPRHSTTPVTSEHQSYLVGSKYLTRNFVN